MPELPDVEISRRYLQSTSLHKAIKDVEVHASKELKGITGKSLSKDLRGRKISCALRHGKHLLAGLDDGRWLTMHFGMTGFLRYHRRHEERPEHTRLRLGLSNGFNLSYDCARRLGRLGLVKNKQRFLVAMRLGPDALQLGRDNFIALLTGRRGQIKSALMDQSLLAGVGNVYSDEILFQAKLHPRLPVKRLGREQLADLHRVLKHVLATAIGRGADPRRLPRRWLTPRRGREASCPGCGGQLKNINAAGRSSWYCPACQPES
ncbi:MAG: hypothetical protein K9L19_18195 [Desulfarculaceae bacterium]|nr:hypothetical protein [Desulfarculaceae bacterium]